MPPAVHAASRKKPSTTVQRPGDLRLSWGRNPAAVPRGPCKGPQNRPCRMSLHGCLGKLLVEKQTSRLVRAHAAHSNFRHLCPQVHGSTGPRVPHCDALTALGSCVPSSCHTYAPNNRAECTHTKTPRHHFTNTYVLALKFGAIDQTRVQTQLYPTL